MDDKRDLSFQSTKRQNRILPEDSFGDWKWRKGLAELMVPIIGGLYRDGINILIYGKSLVNQSPLEIMRAHRFARQADDNEVSELETFPILQYIDSLNLEIKSLDSLIIKKDDSIKNLRNEKKSKVSAVDSFTDDELFKFFTERYRQHIDSLTQRNSKTGS